VPEPFLNDETGKNYGFVSLDLKNFTRSQTNLMEKTVRSEKRSRNTPTTLVSVTYNHMIGKILVGTNPNRMLRSKSRFTWINPPEKFPEYSVLFERERECA
jgi:hypothetical protein